MSRRGRVSILIVIGAALGAGAVSAGISALMMRRVVAPPPQGKEIKVSPVTFLYPLGELTVNLREPGRYLKVSVELEVLAKGSPHLPLGETTSAVSEGHKGEGTGGEKPLPPLAAVVKGELDEQRAKVLDAVIEELSASSFRELLTPQGKRQLRQRIQKAVNGLMDSGQVQEVYFTSFIAQ